MSYREGQEGPQETRDLHKQMERSQESKKLTALVERLNHQLTKPRRRTHRCAWRD